MSPKPKTPRKYALVVTSHRGDLYLPDTLRAARQMLPWGRFGQKIVNDDGPCAWDIPDFTVHRPATPNTGLSAAVKTVWGAVTDADYVFHLEEDYHLCAPVDLDAMADVIERDGLANMVLLRQPALTPEEQHAGGFLNIRPDRFAQRKEYLFHREGFWLNPCLIPADVIAAGGGNEPELTPRWRDRGFGVWGQRHDPPRCLHVGVEGGMGTPGWAA